MASDQSMDINKPMSLAQRRKVRRLGLGSVAAMVLVVLLMAASRLTEDDLVGTWLMVGAVVNLLAAMSMFSKLRKVVGFPQRKETVQ